MFYVFSSEMNYQTLETTKNSLAPVTFIHSNGENLSPSLSNASVKVAVDLN